MKTKLKQFYNEMPLQLKFLILFIAVVAVYVILGVVMSYFMAHKTVQTIIVSYMEDVLLSEHNSVSAQMREVEQTSREILYDSEIYDVLCSTQNDSLNLYENQMKINNIQKKYISETGNSLSVSFVMPDDFIYGTVPDYGLPYAEIRKRLKKTPSVIWYNDKNGIYMARNVIEPETEAVLAVMIIVPRTDFLNNHFTVKGRKNQMDMSIISESNALIASTGGDKNIIDGELFSHMKDEKGTLIDQGSQTLICYARLNSSGWVLVVSSKLKSIMSGISMFRKYLVIACVLSCILFFFLSRGFIISFLKPINRLVDSIRNFKTNKSLITVPVARNDEIGYLTEQYNRMIVEIDTLINKVYVEKIARKNAQIKALQSQIKPHFIYNVLEVINWMARENGVTQISDMVSAFASLLEATAGKVDKLILLKKELEYVNNYMYIMKIRYEENIDVRMKIAPETTELAVPVLFLQPLVENALNHGIGQTDRKGVIVISAFLRGDDLVVEVTDNGCGVSRAKMEEINNRLSANVKDGVLGESKSIGLENTNSRIKLFYGSEYGIKIDSVENSYFKVTCILAAKLPEAGGDIYGV